MRYPYMPWSLKVPASSQCKLNYNKDKNWPILGLLWTYCTALSKG